MSKQIFAIKYLLKVLLDLYIASQEFGAIKTYFFKLLI